jgi:pantothenate synthetase
LTKQELRSTIGIDLKEKKNEKNQISFIMIKAGTYIMDQGTNECQEEEEKKMKKERHHYFQITMKNQIEPLRNISTNQFLSFLFIYLNRKKLIRNFQ